MSVSRLFIRSQKESTDEVVVLVLDLASEKVDRLERERLPPPVVGLDLDPPYNAEPCSGGSGGSDSLPIGPRYIYCVSPGIEHKKFFNARRILLR